MAMTPDNNHEHQDGSPLEAPFVDIHCHILPGIDDGARDRREALDMARIAELAGAAIIATTPHNFPRTMRSVLDESRHRVDLLQRAILEEGIELTLTTGQEVRINRTLGSQVASQDAATINSTRYILVEPPFTSWPEFVDEELDGLIAAGYRPVLAHPERNSVIQYDPDMTRRIIERGVLVQVNTGSLLGHYGPQALETGVYLLRREAVHVLATDAHSATGNRAPNMRSGFEAAALLIGEERARALTRDNPLAITQGRDAPYRPEIAWSSQAVEVQGQPTGSERGSS